MKPSSNNCKKPCIHSPWFLGDFNHLIFWKDSKYGSRRFLECVDENFLIQMIKEPTRKDALLDLILTNEAELVVDVKVGGRLGCTDHETMQFRIQSGGSGVKSRTATLNFRRAVFSHFRDLPGRIPWNTVLER